MIKLTPFFFAVIIFIFGLTTATVTVSALGETDRSNILNSLKYGNKNNNEINPPRCPYPPNSIPINTAAPVLVKTVPQGKLYIAGQGNDTFYVQHVYGTSFEMGYAQGLMHQEFIPKGIASIYTWLTEQAEQKVPWLPESILSIIVDLGASIALEWAWNNTKPYTPQKYIDELTGMANAANVPLQDLINVQMLPVIIKAECSIIGANHNATINVPNLQGGLAHLRSLDGMGGDTMPMKNFPAVTVYHPTNGDATNAIFSFVGFTGCITGFGEYVGLGEKAWNSGAKYDSWKGEPWTFVTRDIINSKSFEDATNTLKHANRTCSVHLGIGGRAENKFRVFEVAADIWIEVDDDMINYAEHPIIPDVIYFDKFSQPTQSYCFADVLQQNYGNIDAEFLVTHAAAMLGSGDLHLASFDYKNQVAYFANARKDNTTDGHLKACHRQFTKLDMAALFNETQ